MIKGISKYEKHMQKAIETFYKTITRNGATPATNYLFKVRNVLKVDERKAKNFHSVTT